MSADAAPSAAEASDRPDDPADAPADAPVAAPSDGEQPDEAPSDAEQPDEAPSDAEQPDDEPSDAALSDELSDPATTAGRKRFEAEVWVAPAKLHAALTDPGTAGIWLGGACLTDEPLVAGGSFDFQEGDELRAVSVLEAGEARVVWELDAPVVFDSEGDESLAPTVTFAVEPLGEASCALAIELGGLAFEERAYGTIDLPDTEEQEALWGFRIEALRALLEEGVDLHGVADGARHLHYDRVTAERELLAAPAEVFDRCLAGARSRGETILSAHRPSSLVTLRMLETMGMATFIRHDLTRRGARTRVALAQHGITSSAPWWTGTEQLIRIPAVALMVPELDGALVDQLDALAADLAGAGATLERAIGAAASELARGLTEAESLWAWRPGANLLPEQVGSAFELFAFRDQPHSAVGAAREAGWPGLEATLLDDHRHDSGELRRTFAALHGEEGEGYLAALELAPSAGEQGSELRIELSGFAGRADALAMATAWWTDLAQDLQEAAEGRFVLASHVDAPIERVRAALTEGDMPAQWLHPEAYVQPGELVVRRFGTGGPVDRVRFAWDEAGTQLTLGWPFGPAVDLGTGVHIEIDLEPRGERTALRLRAAGYERDAAGDRFARLAQARDEWRAILMRIRVATECGTSAFDVLPFGARVGSGRIRIETIVRAGAAACFDAVMRPEAPLLGTPSPDEVEHLDEFSGGSYAYTWGRGRLFVVEPDQRIEHSFPPLGDEPPGSTIVRWAIEALGDGALTRVRVEERGFGWGAAWTARRLRQLRSWRFALEELRARAEHGGSVALPGVRRSLAQGAVRVHVDLDDSPAEAWPRIVSLAWAADEVASTFESGARLALTGARSPMPSYVVGVVLRAVQEQMLEWLMPAADGDTQAIRIILEPRGDGVRVHLTHEGFALERADHRAAFDACAQGWAALLEGLRG